jgi:hypothetical protein
MQIWASHPPPSLYPVIPDRPFPDRCQTRRLSAGFSREWPQAIAQRRVALSMGSGRRRRIAERG